MFVWRLNLGLMLGFNHCFAIQYRAPACNPKAFSTQTASLFYCSIAFSSALHRAKAYVFIFSAWHYGFCSFLLNDMINTSLSVVVSWLSILRTPWEKMFSRVYYSSLTVSNLAAHSSWQCVIWLAYKPHCWEPNRWGLKLYWWLARWGAVSRQRC